MLYIILILHSKQQITVTCLWSKAGKFMWITPGSTVTHSQQLWCRTSWGCGDSECCPLTVGVCNWVFKKYYLLILLHWIIKFKWSVHLIYFYNKVSKKIIFNVFIHLFFGGGEGIYKRNELICIFKCPHSERALFIICHVRIDLPQRFCSSNNPAQKYAMKQSDKYCWMFTLCLCSCMFPICDVHVFVLNCHCLPACISPTGVQIVLQISSNSIYNHSSRDWVFFL